MFGQNNLWIAHFLRFQVLFPVDKFPKSYKLPYFLNLILAYTFAHSLQKNWNFYELKADQIFFSPTSQRSICIWSKAAGLLFCKTSGLALPSYITMYMYIRNCILDTFRGFPFGLEFMYVCIPFLKKSEVMSPTTIKLWKQTMCTKSDSWIQGICLQNTWPGSIFKFGTLQYHFFVKKIK